MASLWDVLPVVSTLDTLPAVRVSDVLPVPVDWLPLSVVAGIVCLWLLIGSRWDVLPVACGLVAVVSVGVGCAACGQFPRYPASGEGVAVVSVGRMVSLWPLGCAACL